MVGILIQLSVSWLIVWLYERGNLNCLGLLPTRKRLSGFLLFFLITAACSASGFLLQMLIGRQRWILNADVNATLILNGVWFTIKSVLFEELIFRGVLLYILIKKLGASWAIIISAVAFGVYHWFSHELFGQPWQMAISFAITGIMGLVLAYGYAKTFSLYVPIAIHLGWNILQMVVFSGSTIGKQLLVQEPVATEITISYFSYIVLVFFPLLSCWIINILVLRKYKQASPVGH